MVVDAVVLWCGVGVYFVALWLWFKLCCCGYFTVVANFVL